MIFAIVSLKVKGISKHYTLCDILLTKKISDAGGSIIVHAFGAYFGLAVSFMMRPKRQQNDNGINEGSVYTSDIFAMIGTLFLWIFWPSFNSALLNDITQQHRAILNTYLSLAAATGINLGLWWLTLKNMILS